MKTFEEIYNKVLLGKREPTTREGLFDHLSSKGNVRRDVLADTFICEKYNRSKRVCHVKDIIKPPTTSICKKLLNHTEEFIFSGIVPCYRYGRETVDVMTVIDNNTKLCISLEVTFKYKSIPTLSGLRNTFERKLKVGFATKDTCPEKVDALSSMFNKYEKDLLALTLYELFKEKRVQEERELEIAEKIEQERKDKYKEDLRKELIEQYKDY